MYPWILIILTVLISEQSQGARILSLLTFPGKSHYINVQPIMQELAERGHEVTVITANPEKNPPPNYNQIVIDNRPFWESCKYILMLSSS